jgi:outer membrane protein OmpA-like peptidoglycan-associated protein
MRIGILGGFQQSEIRETNDLPNWDELKGRYSKRSGIHLGFVADIPFSEKSNLFFQPAVILSQKGRKYTFAQDSTVSFTRRPPLPDSIVETYYSEARKQYLNYIDIPFNVVYKFKLSRKTSFMLGAGPYLSFYFNGSDKTDKYVVGVSYKAEEEQIMVGKGEGKYRLLDWGINGLAGFEFGRVFLTANYSRGMSNAFEPSGYEATEFKHTVMGLRLGVYLGKPVKLTEKDTDKDGVPDKDDQCPTLAGPAALKGCPDQDGDGIIDPQDHCPAQPGPAENHGCPYRDSDKDGILDKNDKCPDQPGPADNDGCPYPDRDKDGILDKDDKCPDVPGLARYNGCPAPDSDGDGLTDEEDKCPNEKGTVANNGCPEIKQEVISKVSTTAKSIAFKVNKAELTPASFKALDDLVKILNEDRSLRLTIEGHTSSEGSRELNMRLSTERAGAVKQYLESKGIAPGRLIAQGFGPDKPLNAGRTSEEKAKNRRVELKLSN